MREVSMAQIDVRAWRWRAVALSAAAALIHMLVTPLYFQQWVGYGTFFVVTAMLQGMGAMALAVGPPSKVFYWLGVVGNAAVIGLWIITRTVGIPLIGPAAGQVLPVGVPDLLATLVEVVLVIHLLVILAGWPRLDKRPLIE